MDGIVDQLLDGARTEIAARDIDRLALPDITETFKKRVGPAKITGKFEARDGWAKSLSSVQRTGPATMSEDGDKIVIDVPLGLSDLQIG